MHLGHVLKAILDKALEAGHAWKVTRKAFVLWGVGRAQAMPYGVVVEVVFEMEPQENDR